MIIEPTALAIAVASSSIVLATFSLILYMRHRHSLPSYLEKRPFEWSMTLSTLGLAVLLTFWPGMLRQSAFHSLLEVLPETVATFVILFIGWFGLIGLFLNGQTILGYRAGPLIRAFAAAARAMIWGQFTLALVHLSWRQGFPSPGIPFWAVFTVVEISIARRVSAISVTPRAAAGITEDG